MGDKGLDCRLQSAWDGAGKTGHQTWVGVMIARRNFPGGRVKIDMKMLSHQTPQSFQSAGWFILSENLDLHVARDHVFHCIGSMARKLVGHSSGLDELARGEICVE